MTVEEALSQACACLDNIISKAIADGEAMMRSKGATDAEIEDLMAWYSKELDAFKQDAMAKMKTHMEGWIARDGASLH
jgi:hypothetical protein